MKKGQTLTKDEVKTLGLKRGGRWGDSEPQWRIYTSSKLGCVLEERGDGFVVIVEWGKDDA